VDAQRYVMELITKMRARGCDAAGLCCTELPILLAQADPPLPVLDFIKCLAAAAISRITGIAVPDREFEGIGVDLDTQAGEG